MELLVPPDLADQKFRLWLVDSSMCLEGPENFTHNHNPYTRTPPFGKVFLHLGRRTVISNKYLLLQPLSFRLVQTIFRQTKRDTKIA